MFHTDLCVHLWADLSYKHFINKVCWNSRYIFFPISYQFVFLLFVFFFSAPLKENNAYVELEDF